MRTITLTAVIGALILTGCSTETSDGVVERHAKYACEDAVKDQLKSPSSAKFQHDAVNGSRDTELMVIGKVDAENSFGAMIRNTYTCSVTWSETDDAVSSAEVIMLN